MYILRSTFLIGRFAAELRTRPVMTIFQTQARCINMKISKATPPEKYTHEERNEMAGRPLSPYLTVYAPQLTSMMSISHRFAGMILSGYAIMLATASFYIPDMESFACAIAAYGIPSPIIFVLKLMLGFPCVYHLCNGVRHLTWDIGKALELKQVYIGGYITLAIASVLAVFVAL